MGAAAVVWGRSAEPRGKEGQSAVQRGFPPSIVHAPCLGLSCCSQEGTLESEG